MKFGIIKEGKIPPDSRVPLVPDQCAAILEKFPIELVVQHSPARTYKDEEYAQEKITLVDDLTDCEVLLGVKEVPIEMLIPGKTYFFFSHTSKKQPYNQGLLQAILEKNIRLIDYELLTDERGFRLIAFGRFAGMVGAHNALYTYSKRTGAFDLPRMKDCHDYEAAKNVYQKTQFPSLKVVVTGGGRVANGACEVLGDMGFTRVSPGEFLSPDYDRPVFTQLDPDKYASRKDGQSFTLNDFFAKPQEFDSAFSPYAQVADVFINGIFYDPKAPAFFTVEEMSKPEFNIQVIADVTCDIAPDASVPSTLRPSTIADPIYGFDPATHSEAPAHQAGVIDIMAIDNLPNEMPRDASRAFGEQFIEHILPELLKPHSPVIEGASITDKGRLTPDYAYLQDFVDGID